MQTYQGVCRGPGPQLWKGVDSLSHLIEGLIPMPCVGEFSIHSVDISGMAQSGCFLRYHHCEMPPLLPLLSQERAKLQNPDEPMGTFRPQGNLGAP